MNLINWAYHFSHKIILANVKSRLENLFFLASWWQKETVLKKSGDITHLRLTILVLHSKPQLKFICRTYKTMFLSHIHFTVLVFGIVPTKTTNHCQSMIWSFFLKESILIPQPSHCYIEDCFLLKHICSINVKPLWIASTKFIIVKEHGSKILFSGPNRKKELLHLHEF